VRKESHSPQLSKQEDTDRRAFQRIYADPPVLLEQFRKENINRGSQSKPAMN